MPFFILFSESIRVCLDVGTFYKALTFTMCSLVLNSTNWLILLALTLQVCI